MVSVVYQGRALPLVWLVKTGKKGNFPQALHIELIQSLQSIIPEGADVVVVGDGEFDGPDFLSILERFDWSYVCRTAKNAVLYEAGDDFHFRYVCPERGGCLQIEAVSFTSQTSERMQAIAWWDRRFKEPIYLLTNLSVMQESCFFYKQRFRIETFFSDQKSRGFNFGSEAQRSEKLL